MMKRTLLVTCAILAASPAMADEAEKQKKGKWTFGVGVMAASLPHYFGADEDKTLALPFPYIRYTSEKLTIDRNGIKRKLWDSEHLELTFSGSGSIKVDSKDNKARAGMPDLGWVGSIGPALNWYLVDDKSLYMQFTARKAWAIDGGLESIGWQGESSINWQSDKYPFTFGQSMYYVAKARIKYDTSDYNDYFYGVDSQYVTAERQAYQAESGYSGSQLLLGVNFEGESYRAGIFARYNSISGATFDDSPLIRQDGNFSYGFAYAWLF